MPDTLMQRLKPLALGGRSRSQEDVSPPPPPTRPPSPAPSVTPSMVSSVATYEVRTAQLSQLPYRAIERPDLPRVQSVSDNQGGLTLRHPTPAPPFRLLAPTVIGEPRSASPEEVRPLSMYSEPPRRPPISPGLSITPTPTMPLRPAPQTEERRLQNELRSRPLGDSFYGRGIVNLLTLAWVEAPSGLIATVFPSDVTQEEISDVANHINLLLCGSQAFKHTAAGVLALSSPGQLNRLLQLSGLSPIVAQPAPPNWRPLAARQPPDFLLEGFKMRASFTPDALEVP